LTYKEICSGVKVVRYRFQIDDKTQTIFEEGDPIQSTESAKKIYRELFSKLRNNRDWRAETQRINVKTWTEAVLATEALTYFLGGAEVKETPIGEYNVGSKGYRHYIKLASSLSAR